MATDDGRVGLRVWREYVGEELALFWVNPYEGKKEKIASFWWPTHPADKTEEVEATFEAIADRCALTDDMLNRMMTAHCGRPIRLTVTEAEQMRKAAHHPAPPRADETTR